MQFNEHSRVGFTVQVYSLKNKWQNYVDQHQIIWENILIYVMCLAFILSDWMLGIFSLSDYLFGFAFFTLIISNNFKITSKQLKLIGIILGIIICNIAQNYIANEIFSLKAGIAGFCKITLYTLVISSFYNFIIRHELRKELQKKMNIFAVAVCLIGFYISIALYTDGNLPFEFFWYFTRTDSVSYLFEGSDGLYRLRSVFSEPSYLGYYLLIVLGINLFNKQYIKVNKLFVLLITISIILTFSYSSIGILVLILLLQVFSFETFSNIKNKKINYFYILLIILSLSILLFMTKDIIQVTIIERTKDILTGKDSSASARLFESWQYVDSNHLIRGNGIGHTPDIWNIYAYILSDLGVFAFIGSLIFSGYLIKINYKLGFLFIALNFQKGGYLSAPFYILILLFVLFSYKKKE